MAKLAHCQECNKCIMQDKSELGVYFKVLTMFQEHLLHFCKMSPLDGHGSELPTNTSQVPREMILNYKVSCVPCHLS